MNWQPFIRGGATIGVLLSVAVGAAWSQNAPAPAPATVHLNLTQDQVTVVLQGLNELKFKDVLPTYMAIVQQIAPAQGAAPAEPPAAVALPAPTTVPAPPGDAHLMPLAPGTKSDLAPDTK